MASERVDKEILIRKEGGVAHVTLNRPAALNALTLEMIRILSTSLADWERDESMQAAIITGAGDRAFCAGGDIKAAYSLGMSYRRGETDKRVISLFFGEEYRMNRQLFHCRKPLFAIMDGITMGGGFGVAGPCRFRVATEKTVFAMPEVGIGFFPDVGSTYFLNRCPGQIGSWLAVTGGQIGPADMLYAGLATHYIPQDRIAAFRAALESALARAADPAAAEKAGQDVLAEFSGRPPGPGPLEQNQTLLDKCFAFDTVEEIADSLGGAETDWAEETARLIAGRSPTSLKVALMHLRCARGNSFDSITADDFMLAQHFTQGHDFYEGVRAMVIDRDRQPRWIPARLADVSDDDVAQYFSETGHCLDNLAA